jgi:WD40 repeat protein
MRYSSDAELLQAYLDGVLSTDEIAALEGRLKTEADLADALVAIAREEAIMVEWAQVASTIEQATDDKPAGSPPASNARAWRLPFLRLPRPRLRPKFPAAYWAALPAAVLLLAVLGFLLSWQRHSNGEPAFLAQLEEVQGDVSVITASGTIAAAQQGQVLFAGQELKTGGEGSFAVVRYQDKTQLELSTETLIRLLTSGPPPKGRKQPGKKVFLREGILVADVTQQPEGRPMVVTTPHAEFKVSGTSFRSASVPEATRVELDKGRMQLTRTSDRKSIEIPAGCYVVAAPQIEPFAPQALSARVSKPQTVLKPNTGAILSLAYSPDGATLAIAAGDGTVHLWDTARKQVRLTLGGLEMNVLGVVFSHDGRFLAAVTEKAVKLWDAATGRELHTLQGNKINKLTSVAFSPDGKTLAAGSRDKTVRFWDTASGQLQATLKGHRGAVLAVAFSPSGKSLAAVGGGKDFGEVLLWNVETGEKQAALFGHTRPVRSAVFSPDGQLLATAGADNMVRLWDGATGEEQGTLQGHVRPVLAAAFSPDGRLLATASNDNIVKLWDVARGREQTTFRTQKQGITCLVFSPDGQTLATGGRDKTVRLWDATGKEGKAVSQLR